VERGDIIKRRCRKGEKALNNVGRTHEKGKKIPVRITFDPYVARRTKEGLYSEALSEGERVQKFDDQ